MAIHGAAIHDVVPATAEPASRRGYRVRPADPVAAHALGRSVGVGPAAAQVLLHRGFIDHGVAQRFLEPRLAELSAPEAMLDRRPAAERLARAVRRRERIALFGDYDVDGTTSAAILGDILEALGGEVRTFVANRFEGGYGFSQPALERVLQCEPALIVTLDCGSADHERVAQAKAAGVDVIVIDHHLVPERPLPADAFINPHRPECGFAYKGLCTAGLAFSMGAAVRAELGARLDVRPWLDLVALGTVADVAPLDGDNRALVRAGLRLLSAPQARPGIQALREVAGIKPNRALGARELAFRLAPRLNAPGRLGDPAIVVELLRARDLETARKLARQVEALNVERKAAERHTTESAIADVERLYGPHPEQGIVVAGHGWHRGVVGISAARLVDRFDVPAIVIALDDEGMGHGSGRTPEGFDLHAAISRCDGHLERFGGHAAAAGVTIRAENLDAFRDAFRDAAPRPEAGRDLPLVDVELGPGYPLPSVNDLMRLEPLGEANAQPLFALRDAVVEDASLVGDGQHLKLRLRLGDRRLTAFGGGMASQVDELGSHCTILGHLRPDLWRGGDRLELSIDKIIT